MRNEAEQRARKREMYIYVIKVYNRIMDVERNLTEEERNNQQWKNIMYSLLSLMLATDADDAFLRAPDYVAPRFREAEKNRILDEYERALKRYGSMFTKK